MPKSPWACCAAGTVGTGMDFIGIWSSLLEEAWSMKVLLVMDLKQILPAGKVALSLEVDNLSLLQIDSVF